MKKSFLLGFLCLLAAFATAQNKMLGIGTANPNANAVLHVESPSGNQGFLMPRLTTSQRSAMSAMLSASDNGLMLYDTDLNTVFVWDGNLWKTTAQAAGGAKLSYPYVDTVKTSPNNTDLLNLLYAGSGTENVGVANFQNFNPNNGFSTIFATTNSATNGVADFVLNNPANTNDAVGVTYNGLGRAGNFSLNNAANHSFALYAESNGDSTGAAIQGNNIGNGMGVFGKSSGSKYASAAVYGEHNGTGDAAGAFRITNTANGYSALFGETNGTGVAVFGNQIGLGRAGQFQITNPANNSAAIRGFTSGTSNAGFFTINNPANTAPGIYTVTNGSGAALNAENTGTGNGFAGLFMNTHSANGYPGIQAGTQGFAPAIRALQDSTSIGPGMDIFMQNTAGTAQGFVVTQLGLGTAASFNINNTSNTASSIYATTNSGQTNTRTIIATHTGAGTGDVIFADRQGSGTGSAGNFQNSNPANSAAALYANSNSSTGPSLGLHHFAEGNAVSIMSGGVSVSTITLSTGTLISNRAAAYLINGGGPYTFDAAVVPLGEGNTFYFFNNTAAPVTVEGISISPASGRTSIVLGGTLRGF
jgi:hypothetical protein